jgi:hypothetical protein
LALPGNAVDRRRCFFQRAQHLRGGLGRADAAQRRGFDQDMNMLIVGSPCPDH